MTDDFDHPHLLLSGPLSVGKTTLAKGLANDGAYEVVSARAVLRGLSNEALPSRDALQRFGQRVEADTGGRWLADYLGTAFDTERQRLIVDSLRTREQVAAVRAALHARVLHLHLTAEARDVAARFNARRESDIDEAPDVETALAHQIDASVEDLAAVADVILDTSGCDAHSVRRAVRDLLSRRR